MELDDNAPCLKPSPREKEKAKPPPITIQTDIKALIRVVTSLNIPKRALAIKETNSDQHAIYIHSLDHYQTIAAVLLQKEIQYFTFTPKSLEHKSFLIKGIRKLRYDEIK